MRHSPRTAGRLAIIFLAAGAVVLPVRTIADTVEKHGTLTVTYRQGQGTSVDMVGVAPRGLLGQADVKRNEGRTRVKLRMDPLPHPQSFGSLYTTYVLWAVAPEGRAESLVELPHSKKFDVDTTTTLASFGLIVTAEPHSAVARPGPRLVAENAVRDDTRGRLEIGTVEYEPATEREAARSVPDPATPLLVQGARRAVEMARAAGARELADAELREAEVKLAALEQLSAGRKKVPADAEVMARDVMRLAEHARALAVDRQQQADRAAERRAARSAVAQAETEADQARAAAERDRQQAANAREEAERAEREAAAGREQTRQAEAEAESARLAAESARLAAERAEQEKTAMQERLFQSLSAVLETRREARGLIVNLSDVLFDFNQATLRPGAREKLSKLAGILLAYPGPYGIEIEGHTDAVGSHDYNERLSRGRAESVHGYVVQAGIAPERIRRVTGFGETRPVTGNDTAAGRQMNRRVELVITDLEP